MDILDNTTTMNQVREGDIILIDDAPFYVHGKLLKSSRGLDGHRAPNPKEEQSINVFPIIESPKKRGRPKADSIKPSFYELDKNTLDTINAKDKKQLPKKPTISVTKEGYTVIQERSFLGSEIIVRLGRISNEGIAIVNQLADAEIDRSFSANTPKKRKSAKKETTDLSRVPDIYLEDAHDFEIISEDLYKTLTQSRAKGDIVTLREARSLAQKGDLKLDLSQITPKFDDTLTPEKFEKTAIIEHAKTISLTEAFENVRFKQDVKRQGKRGRKPKAQNLITDETYEFITLEANRDGKALEDISLGDALMLLSDHQKIKSLKRPNNSSLSITDSQITKLEQSLKHIFDVFAKEYAEEIVMQEIENCHTQFMTDYSSAINTKLQAAAFMRFDPAKRSTGAANENIKAERARLVEERPKKLKFS